MLNKKQMINLEHAKKEMELIMFELEIKNNTDKYLEWKYKEILIWIMSLEYGRYKSYYNILSKTLKEESLTGLDLCEINVDDLHRFGITKFSDKKELFKHIKNLINKNNVNCSIINNDEGISTVFVG